MMVLRMHLTSILYKKNPFQHLKSMQPKPRLKLNLTMVYIN